MSNSGTAGPTCWVFKIADKPKYPDKYGKEYVYDSSHSVKVNAGDRFLYLRKSGRNQLEFAGSGFIERVLSREPDKNDEPRRKRKVFTARLAEFTEFERPITISPRKVGDENRTALGFSRNLNDDGLSRSVCRIPTEQFEKIVALASSRADLEE